MWSFALAAVCLAATAPGCASGNDAAPQQQQQPEDGTYSSVRRTPLNASAEVTRLAFGSCSKQFKKQPMWRHIADRAPDMWAWLGDIVYADTPVFLKIRLPATSEQVESSYRNQMTHPAYRRFLSRVPVVGVWDDHDYGTNDGDKHMKGEEKEAARDSLFRFLGLPADDPRWKWGGGGAWGSYLLGPPGRRVHLLLLDNRSHRDRYPARPFTVNHHHRSSGEGSGAGGSGSSTASSAGTGVDASSGLGSDPQDMLGPEQWAWLEEQLRTVRAEVTLIASGIQMIGQGDPGISENWARLPQSQARLLSLLAVHNVSGVVLLSGDVHFTETNRLLFPGLGYTLYDFTSSGLTHSWDGPLKRLVVGLCMLGHTRHGPWHNGRNWGEVDISWRGTGPSAAGLASGSANGDTARSGGDSGDEAAVAPDGATATATTNTSPCTGGIGDDYLDTTITLRAWGVAGRAPTAKGILALVGRSLGRSAGRFFGVDSKYARAFAIKRGQDKEKEKRRKEAEEAAAAGGSTDGGSTGSTASLSPSPTADIDPATASAARKWGKDPDEDADALEPFVAFEHTLALRDLVARPWERVAAGARSALGPAVDPAEAARVLALARSCLADPLDRGLTPACAAVLGSVTPQATVWHYARHHLGHVLLFTLLGGAGILVSIAPLWALFGPYPSWWVRVSLQIDAAEERALKPAAWWCVPARVRGWAAAAGRGIDRACCGCCSGSRQRQGGAGSEAAGGAGGAPTAGVAAPPPKPRYVLPAQLLLRTLPAALPWRWRWVEPPVASRVMALTLLGLALAGLWAYIQTLH